MVTHGDGGSFWSVVKRGAEEAARGQGVELQYTESSNDPQKQAQMIAAAVTSKVDGLAVSVPSYDAIRAELRKAVEAGIPLITLNAGEDIYREIGAIGHVGQNESIAGEAVGARLQEQGKKKVLCVIHEQSNISLTQRCEGVRRGLTGGTVETMQVTGTRNVATSLTEMQSKLRADGSIDGIVTLNGEIADAAVDAIRGAHSKATLMTFDLSGPVVEAIQAGDIESAVDQQQYLQGYLPIVMLTLYNTNLNTVGGGQPVLTGPSFVDRDNAEQVQKLASEGTR
nr:sugar ABC transporter substrate-binding protein [Conexibacter arvalis]